jgi:hypothetical protein
VAGVVEVALLSSQGERLVVGQGNLELEGMFQVPVATRHAVRYGGVI